MYSILKRRLKLYHLTRSLDVLKRNFCDVPRVAGFRSYEEERSWKLKVPEKFNFASDVIDQWAQREKNGLRNSAVPAFWFVSENGNELKISFEELEYQTKRIASILENTLGVRRGDAVIVMLPKIPEFYFLNISALRVGCVLSPASTMLTTKDLVYRFKALNPVCVIAHDSVADTVEEAAECLPTLKQKVIVSKSPNKKFGWFDLNHIQLNSDDHKCAVTRSDESMAVFFTSGTTGYPKMVEHTHASFPLSLGDLGKYTFDLNSDNMSWSIADTGWGLTAYSIFSTWSRGACLFIHEMPRFSPQTILQMLSKYPIDSFVAPPLVYKSLLAENIASHKLSKLEHCCCGGEALNPEIIRKWRASTGLKIHNVYGQTESTALITCRKTFEYREGSLGKPVPGMKVTIVDENEEELGVGVIGEIVAERKNAVGLFKGYKDNPKATKAVLTEKYFHSGDLGYYDKDGYFWYAGRNDDLINSAGYRIGPVEVENALMEHSAVREVAVISSPDSKRGEVVKAFIILNESVKPSEALINELQDHCKRMTAPYKYPRKIEFVSDMPKTISGKILRKELKQREWKNS